MKSVKDLVTGPETTMYFRRDPVHRYGREEEEARNLVGGCPGRYRSSISVRKVEVRVPLSQQKGVRTGQRRGLYSLVVPK